MTCHSISYPSSDHFPSSPSHSLPLNTAPGYFSFSSIHPFFISVLSLPTRGPFQVFWILQALQVKCTNVKMMLGLIYEWAHATLVLLGLSCLTQ